MGESIDYLIQWVEIASYTKITSKHIAKFINNNVIYRYGVPYELKSDRGTHFKEEVAGLLEKYEI